MEMEEKEDLAYLEGDAVVMCCSLDKSNENPRDVLFEWNTKYEEGTLGVADFKEHWKKFVPACFSCDSSYDLIADNAVVDALIENLEMFIAGGDFTTFVQKVQEEEKPPSICGRVFNKGEPTYSCRDCGKDATCVLCVTCFKKSAHRNHNYRMGSSSNGGCCDCGDVEAWKNDVFCDIHLAGSQATSDSKLPISEDVANRCRIAFRAVLRYAFDILTLQHSPKLPHDLRVGESIFDMEPDIFCTVLYNDEVHTFEQVISTLSKIVKCSQKRAIEYVTHIDREGRSVVKIGLFQRCQDMKSEVERFTGRHGGVPLRADVVHVHVINHQTFTMRLLKWMQDTLTKSESFRSIFAEVVMEKDSRKLSIVEGIFSHDWELWKAARTHWHRLFITGLFMEYSKKLEFGKLFTKNYGNIIKDFIKDDHDHSFSISSLSVQCFTVPTIALHLIEHEEALFILLNTFLSECTPKLNRDGKLLFERNGTMTTFKRAHVILYDLRYLLSVVPTPDKWTDGLRKGFLSGLSLFIKLMKYMQGMDAALRQVVQHMEFEPEWESAFNLHIKLAHVISSTIEWCGSDKVVLVKACKMCISSLAEVTKNEKTVLKELAKHSTYCIQYDVASQPVSIHLPLTRFFAGLFLQLSNHGLNYNSIAQNAFPPDLLLEPVLRTQVMIAQVHAGMWRRNGYSILNQLYFYHNVRCRAEMLDRDIILLQIVASLMEPDTFLIHVVNKFGLMNWADPNYEEMQEEESMRQTIHLVEEMLGLLISMIGERTVPGVGLVTIDDQIKKEIVQRLCIKPLSHSELDKTLVDNPYCENALERVIADVANFKKPDGQGKGVYELKDEFYEQYNLYYYHYTREELSKSEEAQRRRRKAKGLLECCPPPKLVPFVPPFDVLPALLQCDVMMHILQTVLKRSLDLRAQSFSEHQLQKAIYLIGFALQEEQSQRYPCLWFAEKSESWQLERLITQLSTSPRVESHKDMLLWVLERFKASKEEPVVAAAQPEGDKDVKEWRAKMAAEKRAKIMAQMAAMQKSFMAGNADLLSDMDQETESVHESDKPPVTHTCILCQQDTVVSANEPALVLCALVQKSLVHAADRKNIDLCNQAIKVFDFPLFRTTTERPQVHTSTCGHVMHRHCWKSYFDNVQAKETRRPYRLRQPTSFDVERQEFLCPLCECLANTVIPLLPPMASSKRKQPELNSEGFMHIIGATLKPKNQSESSLTNDLPAPSLETTAAGLLEPYRSVFIDLFSEKPFPELCQSHTDMITHFTESIYGIGMNMNPTSNSSAPLLAWDTIYYTFLSASTIIKDKPLFGQLPMRQDFCLEALTLYGSWLATKNSDCSDRAMYILRIMFYNGQLNPCLLDLDAFGLLVALTLSMPSLFTRNLPVDGVLSSNILLLCYYAQIATVLIRPTDTEKDMETETAEGDALVTEVSQMLNGSCRGLWSVKQNCSQFLRCAALFTKYLFNRQDAPELEVLGGDTFENLIGYLRLPDVHEVLKCPTFLKFAISWSKHPRIEKYSKIPIMISSPHLVPLPNDYSELIDMVSLFGCRNSAREDSRNPTMCLVCGEMLCSQSYCCQQELNKLNVGACTYHAHRCGAGVSIFLRIRECEILILASQSRGCFLAAPYLDRYGETDQGLRRGNALTLCLERYAKLEKMWLSHQLYEEIARSAESASGLLSTPWQHL